MNNPEDNSVNKNNSQAGPDTISATGAAIGAATEPNTEQDTTQPLQNRNAEIQGDASDRPKEHGGSKGLEPTRYGDWERNGRCTDF